MFTRRAWQRLNSHIEKVELNAMGRNISTEHIDQPATLQIYRNCQWSHEHIAHRYDRPVKASGVINDKQAGPNHYLM